MRSLISYQLIIMFVLSFCSVGLYGQERELTDFLDSLNIAMPDTIQQTDSTKVKKKIDVDDVIYADASDSLTFDVRNKLMFIFGKGELKYKQTDLKSAKIFIDFNKNSLDAFGRTDTSDSTSQKLIETPVLNETGEVYEGTSLKYNFKTQQGFISMAKNVEDNKRYEGEKVKKVDKETYFIEDGMYTTCESDTPHTYFTASKMKVIQKDKIIAEWIFMHVGGVPFPIPLPFAVFPNKSGRRSGVIIPSYGEVSGRGQYFRNFGYFFAISDYMDFTLTGDYYTKGGYGLRGRYRYKQRYDFSGNVNGGISRVSRGESSDPNFSDVFSWNLNVFHHHDITPTMKLDANLQFLSSKYLEDNSRRLSDLLKQDIVSNATFVKRWDESGNSLTINYSRTQNLQLGNVTEILPNVNFNMSQKYPFRKEGSSSRTQEWYEYIGYTYSSQFKNERRKNRSTDTTDFDRTIRGGVQHNIRVNASPKLGFFNITPSINYTEKWYDKIRELEYVAVIDTSDTTYVTEENIIKKIGFVRTFDFGVSASTKIYGMLQPGVLGIKAFRHTLTPSISYTYQPDFTDEKWGYYASVYNPDTKRIEKYDKFANGIFSGATGGERQSISLSIGNVFEIKTEKDPTDTTSQEEKIQLLNLTASTSYDFVAEEFKLAPLSLSYRTQIGQLFSFNGSSGFTFYDYEVIESGGKKSSRLVNRYLISEGKGLMRLQNFSLNLTLNLAGSKATTGRSAAADKSTLKREETDYEFKRTDYIEMFEDDEPDFTIPWNLNLNYNYSYNKSNVFNPVETSGIGMSLSMSLSAAWKISFRGNYDFIDDKFNAPQITVYRDLHCWEMNFTWNPVGVYRGFRLEIRMKAPELQDIKVTKTKDIYSGF